jgi:hypothetical protein
VITPHLPRWLEEIELRRVRVGDARVSLRFVRGPRGAFAEVIDLEGGPIKVHIEL